MNNLTKYLATILVILLILSCKREISSNTKIHNNSTSPIYDVEFSYESEDGEESWFFDSIPANGSKSIKCYIDTRPQLELFSPTYAIEVKLNYRYKNLPYSLAKEQHEYLHDYENMNIYINGSEIIVE